MSLFDSPRIIHIGFTGTQQGMTEAQKTSFMDANHPFRRKSYNVIGHHGDCVGSDADAHEYWDSRGWVSKIIIHPPDIDGKRAFCKSDKAQVLSTAPYLVRNHAIVGAVEYMIATPKEEEEQIRSGTWATIRYAAKKQVPGLVIFPNGQVKDIRRFT